IPEATFGAWAGTAIHDTSSVLAAAFGYGDESGKVATVVKLTRTLFLIPLLGIFTFVYRNREVTHGSKRARLFKSFPLFILGFLALSGLSSLGVLPETVIHMASKLGKLLITIVL